MQSHMFALLVGLGVCCTVIGPGCVCPPAALIPCSKGLLMAGRPFTCEVAVGISPPVCMHAGGACPAQDSRLIPQDTGEMALP